MNKTSTIYCGPEHPRARIVVFKKQGRSDTKVMCAAVATLLPCIHTSNSSTQQRPHIRNEQTGTPCQAQAPTPYGPYNTHTHPRPPSPTHTLSILSSAFLKVSVTSFLRSVQCLRVLFARRARCSGVHAFPYSCTLTLRATRCSLCVLCLHLNSRFPTSSGSRTRVPRPGPPFSVRLALARLAGKYSLVKVSLELVRRATAGCLPTAVRVARGEPHSGSVVAAAAPAPQGSTSPLNSAPLSSHPAPVAAAPPAPRGSTLSLNSDPLSSLLVNGPIHRPSG